MLHGERRSDRRLTDAEFSGFIARVADKVTSTVEDRLRQNMYSSVGQFAIRKGLYVIGLGFTFYLTQKWDALKGIWNGAK
jgi:hypothetical protein